MKVLVCGGTHFGVPPRADNDSDAAARLRAAANYETDVLETVMAELWDGGKGMRTLIHTGRTGAEIIAGRWADRHSVYEERFELGWGRMNIPALIEAERPDIVIAFPGGRDVDAVIDAARRFDVPVRKVAV